MTHTYLRAKRNAVWYHPTVFACLPPILTPKDELEPRPVGVDGAYLGVCFSGGEAKLFPERPVR